MSKYAAKTALVSLLLTTILCGCRYNTDETEPANADAYVGESITVGELEADAGTDVVLVMDESGSMLNADKERISIEGAKLFVDMEKLSNANIGLIEFSNVLKSTALLDVSMQENRETLKGILDGVEYGSTAHTDTGAALIEAVNLLNTSGSNKNKSVILFTDGKTDIDAGTPGRTLEDSLRDVDTAVQIAKEKGYVIYCIGLNENGGVDEAQLAQIAQQTGGEYLIAADVSEITDFFERIFAQIGDSDVETLDEYVADGNYHTVHFDIDNANILEANIVILSSKEVEDVLLLNPEGNQVDLLQDERIVFSKSSKYSMVKIQNPDAGEWCVSVKGVSGDAIRVGRIFSYNLNFIVEVAQADVSVGIGRWDIQAYFTSDGHPVVDNDFYNTLSGSVYITDLETGAVEETPLEYTIFDGADGERCILTASPTFDHPGEYQMTASVQGSGFYRNSDAVILLGTKNEAAIIKELSKIELKAGKEHEIDLDDYFMDEDGDEITYSVDVDSDKIQTSLDRSILTLLCEEVMDSNLVVYADNGSAHRTSCNVAVVCKDPADTIRSVLLGLAVVAAGVVLYIVIRRSGEKISGVFKVSIESCTTDEYGAGNIVTYDILNAIPGNSIGKHGFRLKTFLDMIPGYYMEYDTEKKRGFEMCIQKMQADSGKIKIRGSRKTFEIKIISGNPNVKFVEVNNMLSSKKVLTVSFSDRITGGMPVLEKKFGIRFLQENAKDYQQINITYRKM